MLWKDGLLNSGDGDGGDEGRLICGTGTGLAGEI